MRGRPGIGLTCLAPKTHVCISGRMEAAHTSLWLLILPTSSQLCLQWHHIDGLKSCIYTMEILQMPLSLLRPDFTTLHVVFCPTTSLKGKSVELSDGSGEGSFQNPLPKSCHASFCDWMSYKNFHSRRAPIDMCSLPILSPPQITFYGSHVNVCTLLTRPCLSSWYFTISSGFLTCSRVERVFWKSS